MYLTTIVDTYHFIEKENKKRLAMYIEYQQRYETGCYKNVQVVIKLAVHYHILLTKIKLLSYYIERIHTDYS